MFMILTKAYTDIDEHILILMIRIGDKRSQTRAIRFYWILSHITQFLFVPLGFIFINLSH